MMAGHVLMVTMVGSDDTVHVATMKGRTMYIGYGAMTVKVQV